MPIRFLLHFTERAMLNIYSYCTIENWSTFVNGLYLGGEGGSLFKSKSDTTCNLLQVRVLMTTFHSPPKCRIHSGKKLNCMICEVQNFKISCQVFCCAKNLNSSSISHLASKQLVPWSLNTREGFPGCEVKCLRQAINASLVRSETSSKCTALTDNAMNKQM